MKNIDVNKELDRLRSTIDSVEKIIDSDTGSSNDKLNRIGIILYKLKEWYGAKPYPKKNNY